MDMLDHVGDQTLAYWSGVDLDALGESVTWAGSGPAPVWLDAAREHTEHWTRQQQSRDATDRPGFKQPAFLFPVLDTFLRPLAHPLRAVPAPRGALLRFTVTGPAGGDRRCERRAGGWRVDRRSAQRPTVELDAKTTWRLCTHGITPREAAGRARRAGPEQYTGPALEVVSIVC
ncbi:hypothetical protein GCM10022402_24660 [Salinactinospora qingdaonensis]|uniref:Mycothiol maleylpyruvate isomerase N-terminal domain-containing protein n=1 Tax=Salinactinospora qingdaonensis TaxID=702744 RepID=A0ABP7FPG8_9ACTN